MKFPQLTPGVFIQHSNRFSAVVELETGHAVVAYVPTTGRLTGALRPGCRVWLAPAQNPNRVTAFTLLLTELPQGGLCAVNAVMANQLFEEAVSQGLLSAFPYANIEKEVSFGHSRLDFRLSSPQKTCWVEVKSVTYVEDGVGMFPDAPTARGQRHLETLANLAGSGDGASAVFIAQRADAYRFTPYQAIDPDFADTLRRVHDAGVGIHAYRCEVTLEKIEIVEEIPVELYYSKKS